MEKKGKPLNQEEKNICLLAWGCIPVDTEFVRGSNIFQQMRNRYEKYRYLFEDDKIANRDTNKT